MPISFHCPSCNATRSAHEVLAGRKVRCPSCDALVVVPVDAMDDDGKDTVAIAPIEDDGTKTVMLERVEMDPTWLFGDLAEVSFHDEATLEALIERAIERPDWRRAVSDAIAARVRERLTHTALARRLLVAIRDAAADRAGDQPSP